MRNNNTRESVTSSNLGHFPKDWNSFYLDELGNTNSPTIKAGPFGSSLTKSTYVAFGYKVYGQEQVIRNDELWGDYFVSDDKFKELKTCEVLPGDILLSLVGTAGKLLVISTLAPKGIINPRLLRFRFAPDKLNSQFFKYLFESDIIQNYLSSNAQGGTMAVLNAGMLKTLEITIPRIAEQTAIANALSDVDALIDELEKLIAKKQAIKTATMQQLLTGRTRLPEFTNHPDGIPKGYKQTELGEIPEDWEVLGLGFLVEGTINRKPINQNSIVSFVGMQDVSEDAQLIGQQMLDSDSLKSGFTYFERGDVLLAKITPCFENGKGCHTVSLQTQIGFGSTEFHVLRATKDADSMFIYYWSTKNNFRKELESEMVGSAGHRRVPLSAVYDYKIPVPPKDEQTAIANILSDMDEEIQSLQQRLDKTSKIKQGMMQELLTGKTRLV